MRAGLMFKSYIFSGEQVSTAGSQAASDPPTKIPTRRTISLERQAAVDDDSAREMMVEVAVSSPFAGCVVVAVPLSGEVLIFFYCIQVGNLIAYTSSGYIHFASTREIFV
jgi:hypothetical protein